MELQMRCIVGEKATVPNAPSNRLASPSTWYEASQLITVFYRAIPVGVWHTNSPVYGEFYRQNLPAPTLGTLSSPTFQAPERHPRTGPLTSY